MDEGRYLAAKTVLDIWICYPWEATYVKVSSNIQSEVSDTLLVILMSMTSWQRPNPNTRFLTNLGSRP